MMTWVGLREMRQGASSQVALVTPSQRARNEPTQKSEASPVITSMPTSRFSDARGSMDRRAHWEQVYRTKGPDQVSWYQAEARLSRELIERAMPNRTAC